MTAEKRLDFFFIFLFKTYNKYKNVQEFNKRTILDINNILSHNPST